MATAEETTIDVLLSLFKRDLDKLSAEIEHYQDEGNLWIVKSQIKNSGGNLCLHLVGNLNAYIGAELGSSGYIRQRDLEFSAKNIPRKDLIKKIEDTKEGIIRTLTTLDLNSLNLEYPKLVFAQKTTIQFMLIHLATHLNYHLGQVNYHRRLLEP